MAMDKFVCEFMLLMTLSIEQSVNMWAAVASYVQRLRVAGVRLAGARTYVLPS